MAQYKMRMTDARDRRLDNLEDATGENTRSKAIDQAADYYLQMRGDTSAIPQGAVDELLELATDQGNVTPEQIADVLDCEELPVTAETLFEVGE